jgi:hypothetical protein
MQYWVKNPGCTRKAFTVIFSPAEPPATPAREIFGMNPKNLRAGKAADETDRSALLPQSSASEAEKPKASPTPPIQSHKIPQILFEGDESGRPAESAATQKFDLGAADTGPPKPQEAKLPDAYGTGKLLLSARDPHSLFAHWDLTEGQQHQYNSLSADGHLTLRAYAHASSSQPAVEVPAKPESRHLFLQVERAGTSYVGELGYYGPGRKWKTIATSAVATTPPDAPSTEATAVFSTPQALRPTQPNTEKKTQTPTEPAEASIIPVSAPPWPFESEAPSTGESPQLSQPLPDDAPPFVKRSPHKEWTPARERQLAEIIRFNMERRESISSVDIGLPILPGALLDISSPLEGGQPSREGFWFNVNAELIIYGATEPNAQVTIGGRPIQLRPDGTFTCHFALPDGDYALAATAVSPQNELRQATMNFSRHTKYSGEVGAYPQNPSLEPIARPG